MTDFCNDVNDWLTTGGDLSLGYDLTGKKPDTLIRELLYRGVTHVLDVRSEWDDADEWRAVVPYIGYCHAPIVDSWSHDPAEGWYVKVETFVREFLANAAPGDRLYAHCHMGINRGTSAAMLALLVADPALDPYDAFLRIRDARPIAGLVYAERVGRRHLAGNPVALGEFNRKMRDYWTPDAIRAVNRGIAYYRSQEGGTLAVAAQA